MSTLEEERDFVRVNKASYETIDSESIDYAVMESAEAAIVISLDANWSDLGSWDAMHAASEKECFPRRLMFRTQNNPLIILEIWEPLLA